MRSASRRNGFGKEEYVNEPIDMEGLICTGCHAVIRNGQLAFVMNFGLEDKRRPLAKVLRFTGLAWHAGGDHGRAPVCLKVSDLPGCKDRVGIEEEFAHGHDILPGKGDSRIADGPLLCMRLAGRIGHLD